MKRKVQETIEIELNRKQIQSFANAIAADIKPYIEAHREEFEEFLKERGNKGATGK